ncbi:MULTISPECIES: hypothetical protein [Streptomyces]|uniref:ATPase BadF/BadG/BcrA/BcrD type domain-containing protein n=1 Tax=Streptomyces flaveolus TaxID=67297 RepID=A0ABV3AMG0_9ACTN|nr:MULTISPECIES: hypothetical protein [Streptomyces]
MDGLAAEVVTLARTARRQFDPSSATWALVLGGGLFTDPEGRMLAAVRAASPGLEEEFAVRVPDVPPVAGAALLALDRVAAGAPGETVGGVFREAKPRLAAAEEMPRTTGAEDVTS